MDDQVYARYYNLTLRYLSYRPRSEKEVLDYLKEKAKKPPLRQGYEGQALLTPEMIEKIIEKLKEYKFIDDQAFLKFWTESRTKYKRKPLKVVKFELSQKGINRKLIDAYFENIESGVDMENANKLAAKKMEFYRNLDPKKRREKVTSFLLRKGFSYDVVKEIIKN